MARAEDSHMNSHQPGAVRTLSQFAEGRYQVDLEAVADAMLRRCLWIPNLPPRNADPEDAHEPPALRSIVVLRRPGQGHLAPTQSAAA